MVEGFVYNLHLLLEHLPVGVAVGLGAGDTKGVHFPVVVAPTQTEYDPALRQTVHSGEVFGQPQGMPHGVDIESASHLDLLGNVGEVKAVEENVGDYFIPFSLEVVLRNPKGVVAHPVH